MAELWLDDRSIESPREIPEVGLWYPRHDGCARYLEVCLMDVRAADNLRISYDFDRDGWVIEQASIFRWEENDGECDPDWQEVCFVRAWGRAGDGE
jgi:hypothetical protein